MFVSSDFILNGAGHGEVAGALQDVAYDPGLLRPYLDDRGRACVLVNTKRRSSRKGPDGSLVRNAQGDVEQFPVYEKKLVADLALNNGLTKLLMNTAVLGKDQWVTLTNRVIRASRERLRAWSDLMANSSYGGFDGMSTMGLEYQTISDAGEAVVDFDAMTEGRNFRPDVGLQGLPLPITHSDFWLPERLLAISRRNGTPLNTTLGEMAGRRVAEKVEQTLIGTVTGLALGTQAGGMTGGHAYTRKATVWGYTNFPGRITKTNLTTPTGSNPEATVGDILAILELLRSENFYGPFMIYNSTDWDRYLDNDYARLGGSNANMTLRQRLRAIDGVMDVRRLDFLRSSTNPFTLLVVQLTPEVVQAVNGMDITTIQWPSMGGMRINFKVMCIQVPLIAADYLDRTAIVHATTS